MSDERIARVRSLVLDVERLKGEYAKIGEIIAAHEQELSGLFGPARASTAPAAAPPPPSAHRVVEPAVRKTPEKTAGQPTIKETILGALGANPSGVDLSALTALAYGDAGEANRRRCEKLLYKLASKKLVTHEGSRWSLFGAPVAHAPAAHAPATPAAAPVAKKTRAKKAAATPVAAPTAGTKKREWPKCSVPGCDKSMFGPSAKQRLCFEHFQAAGGKHYRHD